MCKNMFSYPCLMSLGFILLSPEVVIFPNVKSDPCDVPEYFGICDPYVPGIWVRIRDRQPVDVLETWPRGPAEVAGICPGDKLLEIGGVSCLELSSEEILRNLISATPIAISLTVLRGGQKIKFNVQRVRESTLARLSRQKYIHKRLVPIGQTLVGLRELELFKGRLEKRYGLRQASEGIWVPTETPQGQAEFLLRVIKNARAEHRLQFVIPAFEDLDDYSLGFSLVSVTAPNGLWLYQVFPGSPAHQHGFFPGYQLLTINGRDASEITQAELTRMLFTKNRPEAVDMVLKHGGSLVTANMKPVMAARFADRTVDPYTGESTHFQTLPGQDARIAETLVTGLHVYYAENPREAIIAEVEFPTVAFDEGLRVGDLILDINDLAIGQLSREQLTNLLAPTKQSAFKIKVSRAGRQLNFKLKSITYAETLSRIGRKFTPLGPVPCHCGE